jgi:thiol-disulfide isomerase/thioredoxin
MPKRIHSAALALAGAALLIGCVALSVWILLDDRQDSTESFACQGCGPPTRQPAEELTVEEMRERTLADGRRLALQGVRVGDTVHLTELNIPHTAEGAYVVFLKAATQNPGEVWPFPGPLLLDWCQEIPNLFVVVVLGSEETESTRDRLQFQFGVHGQILLDPEGEVLAAFRIEEESSGIGFLIERTGHVISRLPPLRLATASAVRSHLNTWSEGTPPPASTAVFGAIHPTSPDQSLQEVLARTSLEKSPTFEDVPTLVYRYAPDCTACEYTSEAALELASTYAGQLNLVGLAFVLSPETTAEVIRYGEWYANALSENQQRWIDNLVINEPTADELVVKARHLESAFPVMIDWDQRITGALGLSMAPLPCWVLYDASGAFVDLIPGGTETVYRDGIPHQGPLPPLDYLQQYLDAFLDQLSDQGKQ